LSYPAQEEKTDGSRHECPGCAGGGIRAGSHEKESKMVKVIFEYEVPIENHGEYLHMTQHKIKPFWESHGCQSYSVWQSSESAATFVKEMLFENMTTMKETMALEEAEPFKEIFYKFAANVSRKICTKKL
jgi:hypothetical protein